MVWALFGKFFLASGGPGKWITIALLGEVSQSLGAARLAGTMQDKMGGNMFCPMGNMSQKVGE